MRATIVVAFAMTVSVLAPGASRGASPVDDAFDSGDPIEITAAAATSDPVIAAAADGSLFVAGATTAGWFAGRVDPATDSFEAFDTSGMVDGQPSGLFVDGDDRVWVLGLRPDTGDPLAVRFLADGTPDPSLQWPLDPMLAVEGVELTSGFETAGGTYVFVAWIPGVVADEYLMFHVDDTGAPVDAADDPRVFLGLVDAADVNDVQVFPGSNGRALVAVNAEHVISHNMGGIERRLPDGTLESAVIGIPIAFGVRLAAVQLPSGAIVSAIIGFTSNPVAGRPAIEMSLHDTSGALVSDFAYVDDADREFDSSTHLAWLRGGSVLVVNAFEGTVTTQVVDATGAAEPTNDVAMPVPMRVTGAIGDGLGTVTLVGVGEDDGHVNVVQISDGSGRFVDDDGSVHEIDIDALAFMGITKGCNPPANTKYCPGRSVTRAEAAAFLARIHGYTDPDPSTLVFIDTAGSIHAAAIDAIAIQGITFGCNPPLNDRFCPDAPVTRAQMASLLQRSWFIGPGPSGVFVDIADTIHAADIEAIAHAEVTFGCNPPINDRYCPDDPVTRKQIASFLRRGLNLP